MNFAYAGYPKNDVKWDRKVNDLEVERFSSIIWLLPKHHSEDDMAQRFDQFAFNNSVERRFCWH
jgi:hypothetical protein